MCPGDSLPAVPFAPERQQSFKDKHPVRAPSFDGEIRDFSAQAPVFFNDNIPFCLQEPSSLEQVSWKVNYRCDFLIYTIYTSQHTTISSHPFTWNYIKLTHKKQAKKTFRVIASDVAAAVDGNNDDDDEKKVKQEEEAREKKAESCQWDRRFQFMLARSSSSLHPWKKKSVVLISRPCLASLYHL